ncbi:MAG: PQQ-binding-like beta-propeller repeat protein [Planctomycetaceae bacterium]
MPGLRFALLAVTAACVTASSLPAQDALTPVLPTRRMLAPYGLERAWWNQATLNPSRDRVRHLVADEDVLIVQSRSGVVTVFDAENGRKLWAVRVGRTDAVSFAATTNDHLALIVIGTEIYALEKFTGKVAWHFDLPAAPSTSCEVDDDLVYVGTRDGSVYAFDLRKIRKFHDEGLLPKWSAQTLQWRYRAHKEVTTPPVSTGRTVNFASRGGSLYSVSAHDRKLQFQFETDRPISAPMGHSKKFLYLPSEDFKLYCISADNGRTRWVYNTGLAIRKQPQVVGPNVFIVPAHGGLHSVATSSTKKSEFAVPFAVKEGDIFDVSIDGTRISYAAGARDTVAAVAVALSRKINAAGIAHVTAVASAKDGSLVVTAPPSTAVSATVTDKGNRRDLRGRVRIAMAGKRLWWRAKITDFVAASPRRVYVTDRFSNLIALDRENGATIAAFPLRHFSVRVANARTDRIFIAKPSGLVVCIRETGRTFPLYHRYPERRPILPTFAPDPLARKPAPDLPARKSAPGR